jgi:hypothetical protein
VDSKIEDTAGIKDVGSIVKLPKFKWEYKVVVINFFRSDINELLNSYGKELWELCFIGEGDSLRACTGVFKRYICYNV